MDNMDPEKSKPANAGARWSEEQDAWLLMALTQGISDNEIASRLERTKGSILSHRKMIAQRLIAEGLDPEEACKLVRITQQQLPKPKEQPRPVFYAVSTGRKVGVFDNWKDCSKSVYMFPGAVYQKFMEREEADAYLLAQCQAALQPTASAGEQYRKHLQEHLQQLQFLSHDPELSGEQQQVLDAMKLGRNIFLTGAPGTGKSFTIRRIVNTLRQNDIHVSMTAMTGAAAVLLKGLTLHSFLGIGLANLPAELLADRLHRSRQKRLRRLQVLVVDEISMMDKDLFQKISDFLSIVRGDTRPFGGVQLLLTGDFCQLPPVKGDYCFLSPEWERTNLAIIELKENHRQSMDPEFQSILAELRRGSCPPSISKRLRQLMDTTFPENIQPTRLFSLRVDTEYINDTELQKLVAASGHPVAVFAPTFPSAAKAEERSRRWAKTMGIQEELAITLGAQVVLTYNLSPEFGLVNGSLGTVTGMSHPQAAEVAFANGMVREIGYQRLEDDDDRDVWVTYLPLKLAYALTIHKSQGMTLDAMEIDIGSSVFESGQAYTALSRAKSLESIKVIDFHPSAFRTDKRVLAFLDSISQCSSSE